jgi:hypothetical protein
MPRQFSGGSLEKVAGKLKVPASRGKQADELSKRWQKCLEARVKRQ